MNEIWLPIRGFVGYQISSIGNVRSVDRLEVNSLGRSRNLKGMEIVKTKSKSGYVNVFIQGRTFRVHRLVAFAFLGDSEKDEVNHKNGIRDDNRVENLEFCTRSENQIHACRVLGNIQFQPSKGKFGLDHHRSKPVVAIHATTFEEQTFEGLHDAQRKTGLDKSNISAACRGKQRTCGGYVWRFA